MTIENFCVVVGVVIGTVIARRMGWFPKHQMCEMCHVRDEGVRRRYFRDEMRVLCWDCFMVGLGFRITDGKIKN